MRHGLKVLMLTLAATPLTGCGGARAVAVADNKPVVPTITPDELRRDLMVFASDSFAGRETGTPAANKAAQFIVRRLIDLGIEPAGDSMYYQRVPLVRDRFGPDTRLFVTQGTSTSPLTLGSEVVPFVYLAPGAPGTKRIVDGDIEFVGYGLDTLGRHDFAGIKEPKKVIVLLHAAPPSITDSTLRKKFESQSELENRLVRALQMQPAAIIILMTGPTRDFYMQAAPELMHSVTPAPGDLTTTESQRPLPMVVLGLAKAGSPLLPANWPNDDAPQALTGRRFTGRVDMRHENFTGYNVVGIVRGTDPRLNKTYVAFGAHYDHIGTPPGAADTIANGADDDGSGSMTILAVAKSLTTSRPRRSALFVWHVGEEKGLLGSSYFVDHPTVPIDSIVAQLNADMIGRRGGPVAEWDSRKSGDAAVNRLYVVGPRAAPNDQSKTLGAILDTVNARQVRPFTLDHEWDTPNHPERIYYRSDHFNYARKGIPILFFTTGLHEDYHKVSDEPSKIDYEKMSRVGGLLLELGTTLGNRSTRPR